MAKISNQQVIQMITSQFSDRVSVPTEPFGLLTFETSVEDISEVLRFLKEDKTLKFNYLTDITAIHIPEQTLSLGVIYHIHSLVNNVRVRIKVYLDIADPKIPSATPLWEGANWMERETYDFFGVIFEGHPYLVRILNVDDMDVFPMRREYPLEDPNRVDKKDYFFGR